MIADEFVGKSNAVSKYYDNNTRRFLKFGKNEGTANIHQALWAQGVEDQQQAVNYANKLILRELEELNWAKNDKVVDLGCGVGASLGFIAQRSDTHIQFLGITLSELQASIGNDQMKQFSLQNRVKIQQGNYLNLDQLPEVQLAFSIEAFVHAADAASFFKAISEKLVLGGRLVIIDDFRTSKQPENEDEAGYIRDFQQGWHAYSLIPITQAVELAASHGLYRIKDHDLTELLPIGRTRDQAIGLMIKVAGRWMRQSTYFQSLTGGYAKQQCIRNGLVNYRMIVFEKKAI